MPKNPKSKLPNAKPLRPPSSRDLEIYHRVRIRNHPQWEVAYDNGINRSRVSQIVGRVDRWLAAGGSPTDPKFKSLLDQHRLSASLQKLRLLRAVDLAAAFLDGPIPQTQRTRSRFVGGMEVWREETTTEAPNSRLFALQTYLSAVKALNSCQNRAAQGAEPAALAPQAALPALIELLCRFRFESESAGQVEPAHDVQALVRSALQQLLGPFTLSPSSPEAVPPVPAALANSTANRALTVSAEPNAATDANADPDQTSHNSPSAKNRGGPPNVSAQ